MKNQLIAGDCSIPCDVCASTEVEAVNYKDRRGDPQRTVICRHCGLVWVDPRPTRAALAEYYEHEYRLDLKQTYRPKRKHVYRGGKVALDRVRLVAPLLRCGARVLDVGAGAGEMVYMLSALGFVASGVEPNRGYADFARNELGVAVECGFYETAQIPPASVDMVTLFHVVEHLDDPREALNHVRSWLVDGGLVYVEVPNVESVCQWPRSLFQKAHLYYFSPATLAAVGARSGFEVVRQDVSSDGGNIGVVLRKAGAPGVANEFAENYERVRSILRRHSALQHLCTSYPYVRTLHRLRQRLDEWTGTRGYSDPRRLLDDLLAEERRRRSDGLPGPPKTQ